MRPMQTIFPSDSEGTKWQKLGANIKEAVMAAAIAVPADLTPINSCDSEGTKWYKLGRWLSLIAGGGTPVPLTGVGYYTPLELLASRNIVDSDAGKWLFNTGGAKTLTLAGAAGGAGYRGLTPAVFNWIGTIGSLGYWLPRPSPGDLTDGIGSTLVLSQPGIRYTLPDPSFYNPDGSPKGLQFIYWPTGTLDYTFTLAQSTRLTIGIHIPGGSARALGISVNSITATVSQPDDGNFYTNPVFATIDLPAGNHVLSFSRTGDNPGINGLWFDPISIDPVVGPLTIGQSIQGFQAGDNAITIDPTGNTLVAPGLTTQGPGSWFEIKKIGDNLYHAHGDLA